MKLWAFVFWRSISWSWGWPYWGHNVHNHSCMNTITKGNSWHYQGSTLVDCWDKLWSKSGVMTENRRHAWPEDPNINSSHHPRRWEEPRSTTNPPSDTTIEEHPNILLRILSTYSQVLPSITFVHMLYMSSWKPIHSQFAHQSVIATVRDLILYHHEQGFTHISRVPLYSAIIAGVGYEVHWYITTGALPYVEWSEEWPWPGKAERKALILKTIRDWACEHKEHRTRR